MKSDDHAVERKPAVYVLVTVPIFAGGGACLAAALVEGYSRVTGMARSAMPNLNGFLIMLPAFFLWIPISLLLANVVLYAVPPLRRMAERYADEAGHPGFATTQKVLLKMTGLIALVCVPLIALGFVL